MQNKARRLSLSGVLLSLTVIALFIESVAPVNKLSLYALSSFFVSVVIIEFGSGAGWLFYLTSCILAAIVVQDKMALIPYILFFGIYGVVKYHIEKLGKLVLEYVLKLLFANMIIFLLYHLFRQLILPDIKTELPLLLLLVLAQAAFLLYDYVYSLFIQYYGNKIKKILKI